VDHYARAYPIFGRIRGLKEVKKMLSSLRRFSQSEVAQQRMKMINFYQQYGEKATWEAFGADRQVISRWQQRLSQSGGRIASLVPCSTRPHQTRQPQTDPDIVSFIKDQREKHHRLGKEKLKVFVDQYCRQQGIPTVSASTIGNIIKRNHFFFQKETRVYHDPASGWAQNKAKKTRRLRVKHSPKPKEFGYIVSDSVERITDGIKDYFVSAIDAKMKFALTLNYQRLTSANMLDFYRRFKEVYPGNIKIWQSDNGSENLGVFDQQLKKERIPHFFIYPHCPQIDTFIERYNRTLQDEFVDPNLETIHRKGVFGQKLSDYIIYYNAERPHHSLGLKSPLQYFVEQGGMSQMSLTYTNP